MPSASPTGPATPSLNSWSSGRFIPIIFFSFSQSKLPGYILPSIPPITILTGDYLYRRRGPGLNRWELAGHARSVGIMTMFALLLPWFVVHGPADAAAASADRSRSSSATGAALLIVIVVKGFGVARLRLATSGVLVVLVLFLYGVGPFFGIPAIASTKRVIHLLDRSYSARPLAERLLDYRSRQTKPWPFSAFAAIWNTGLLSIATMKSSITKRTACPRNSICWWRG